MLPKKVNCKNNIVEILEDEEDEALDEYIKEEVLVKLEKDNDVDTMHTNDKDTMRTNNLESRRSQTIMTILTEDLEDKG
jgi:hypothetical protein